MKVSMKLRMSISIFEDEVENEVDAKAKVAAEVYTSQMRHVKVIK